MTAAMNRRQWLALAGATGLWAGLLANPRVAVAAKPYPDRAVRMIVPFAPGTSADTLARLVSALLGPILQQAVVVENIAGAGGIIGATALKRAEPDGYSIGMLSNSHTANVYTLRTRPYDIGKDFTPIASLLGGYQSVAVHADSPYRTVKDLVAAMRQDPGAINFGSGGPGSPAHLAAVMLLRQAGVQATHVPYKGANDFVLAIMRGQVQFGFPPLSIVLPFVRKGQMRLLAMAAPARAPLVPEVPTLAEALPPGFYLDNWLGLFGPPGLPADRQQVLFEASRKLQAAQQFVDWAHTVNNDIRTSESPAAFGRMVSADSVRYGKLMRELKLDPTVG